MGCGVIVFPPRRSDSEEKTYTVPVEHMRKSTILMVKTEISSNHINDGAADPFGYPDIHSAIISYSE
jgi:hypothetical protein